MSTQLQETLLDHYRPRTGVYDEMCAPDGEVRPHWQYLSRALADLGSGEVRDLSQRAGRDSGPVWSPDGRYVAYTASFGSNPEVLVTDVLDGKTRNASNHPRADGAPVWSPDGRRLAFVSDRDGPIDILILDLATWTLSDLSRERRVNTVPTWSPDGQQIAYLSGTERDQRLIVVDLASGQTVYGSRIGIGQAFGWWP